MPLSAAASRIRKDPSVDDLPHKGPIDEATDEATLTVDRRRIDLPSPIDDRQGPQARELPTGTDPADLVRTMRRRAGWLRLQTRICIVLLAMVLAGGGVIFLDARIIAFS